MLQILAYANLVSTKQVVCCMVYPCATATWESLARRRLFQSVSNSTFMQMTDVNTGREGIDERFLCLSLRLVRHDIS